MSGMQAEIWKGSTFTIERKDNPAAETVVFSFSGPFTARDMYAALTPVALRNMFESDPPHSTPKVNILDLTQVPYMDSCGLGLIIGHFVRCQNKGIRLHRRRRHSACSAVAQNHEDRSPLPHDPDGR